MVASPRVTTIRNMDVAPGQDIDYYINIKSGVGSGTAQYSRFALVQLLDYKQVPLRRDTPGARVLRRHWTRANFLPFMPA